MTIIDGRQVIPASDLPQRPAGRNDVVVGVTRSGQSLSAFPVSALPTPDAAQAELDALKAGQQTSAIYADTLPDLQAVLGTYVGQGGFVNNGVGAGQYIWSGSAWVFSRADVFSQKADKTALAATNQKFEPLERIGNQIAPFTVLDASGRVLATLTGEETTVFNYERLADVDAPVPLIVDGQQRVLQYMPGELPSDEPVDADVRSIQFPERMRKTQLFRSGREAGVPLRLSLAVIGDSWVDVTPYWLENFSRRMRTRYGDGGIGYVDFGSGVFLREGLTRTIYGFERGDETVPGPAIYSQFASANAGYTLNVVGAQPLASARLFWIGRAGGVCRYRWNGGPWTTLNVQAEGTNFTDLLLAPIDAVDYSFEVQWVSGTIELCGIDLKSESPGLVIHKLGNSGSRADDWIGVDAQHWQRGITGIAPDAVIILLGTNDKSQGIGADVFADEIGVLVGRIRAALPDTSSVPGPDVMVVVPSQVWRSTAMPMGDYRDAVLAWARSQDVAVTDLIDAVGDPYTRRTWFDADGVHPTPDGGGLVVAGRIFEALHS